MIGVLNLGDEIVEISIGVLCNGVESVEKLASFFACFAFDEAEVLKDRKRISFRGLDSAGMFFS
jgi:hypothetical protein